MIATVILTPKGKRPKVTEESNKGREYMSFAIFKEVTK